MRENTFVICAAFLVIGGSFLIQQWNRGTVDSQNTSRSCGYGCPLFPGLILPRDPVIETGNNDSGKSENRSSDRVPL